MIYTVTFNPAIDYTLHLNDLKIGQINKHCREQVICGGKGINVSAMLSILGEQTLALGFFAGFTGKEMERLLKNEGLNMDFIMLPEGMTRINVKIRAAEETDLNTDGPDIPQKYLKKLLAKIDAAKAGDILCLSGSVPNCIPQTFYATLARQCKARGVGVVIDAVGDLLKETLQYEPFVIKPNREELAQTTGLQCDTIEQVVTAARELQNLGAKNVLVSLGGDGAVLLPSNGDAMFCSVPKGTAVNTVAAGDSALAGYIHGFLSTGDQADALLYAVAAGSSTAFSDWLGNYEQIRSFVEELRESGNLKRL